MKVRLEYIRWQDAFGSDGSIEPAKIEDEYFVNTAGAFLRETPTTVILTQDSFPDSGRVRSYMVIPKAVIVVRKTVYVEVPDMPHKGGYPPKKKGKGKKK